MNKFLNTLIVIITLVFSYTANAATPLHGIAMHGEPKYTADFKHLDYANPNAPKGGELKLATQVAFDSVNPFVIKGMKAPGIGGLVYQTLMESSEDEAFSEYGLIAETMEVPDDRSWVIFNLRENAKWHDGQPITADDVVFSFNTLTTKGHPFFRSYYGSVESVVAENSKRVKFIFKMKGNRELPLIIGQMFVLPRHFWQDKEFDKSTIDTPMGSGPYKIKSFESGRRIVFERVKNWWGKDLAINKGRYNFDTISYDLFRDETVLLQALFSGNYDFKRENIAKSWNSEYNVKPVIKGLIKKEEITHSNSSGMQGFVFNLRRPMFNDVKTRQALNYAFDFEWSNKQFAYGMYKRTDSYFSNSELAATGVPKGRELEILEQYKSDLPPELFEQEFKLPKTSGSGKDIRKYLRKAKNLLKEAGWKVGDNGLLVRDGQEFKFEFLTYTPAFKRWINPMILNLKKLGIEVTLRIVDTAQYQKRTDTFDFDMTGGLFAQSLSPGNEQHDFWGSDKADVQGSKNLIGVKNPIIDKMIEELISAPNREELIFRTRALDRVLLWNYYLIPNWYTNSFLVAYWDKFGQPTISPKYGLSVIDTWWIDTDKVKALKGRPIK